MPYRRNGLAASLLLHHREEIKMLQKTLLPFAAVAILATAPMQAEARNGRNGAAALGLAAGVAVGAVGATILADQARAQPRPAPGYYAVSAPEYEPVPTCVVRPVELFDRAGTYVKTERMRVCR